MHNQKLMNALVWFAVVVVGQHFALVQIHGQTKIANPEDLGFDVEVLEEIDGLMKAGLEDEKLIGCNAMILKDDKICYYDGWGLQSREDDVPVSRETIWRIYSMSKPITSVAVMQLVESGKLNLDDLVEKHIPEFADLKVLQKEGEGFVEVAPRRGMTVRDLLRHSSGLTYGFFGDSEVDKRYRKAGVLVTDPDLKSMVGKLSKIPLQTHPGDTFIYSVSTDVLGYLVEVVSGKSFAQYLEENIFEPLSMTDTSFVVPEKKQDRFAAMYRPSRSGGLSLSSSRSSKRFTDESNEFFSGGGGLCCDIDDYMQFCRMLLNKGTLEGKQILKAETLEQMWTNQLGDLKRSSRGFQFGLGFSISPQGDYSWGGAAGTRFWVNPEKNIAMVYMVQINPYRQSFGRQMRKIVYDSLRD